MEANRDGWHLEYSDEGDDGEIVSVVDHPASSEAANNPVSFQSPEGSIKATKYCLRWQRCFLLSAGQIHYAIASDSDLKFSKYPPETMERLNKLMPGRSREAFTSKRKSNWPAMRRPKAPDALRQAKADEQYRGYLLTLEQSYARIRKKCDRSTEYEKFLKKRLISMGCPSCVLLNSGQMQNLNIDPSF